MTTRAVLLTTFSIAVSPFVSSDIKAQDRAIASYPVEQLPQSAVSSIARDEAGFLWIGTHDGLARYDGQQFQGLSSEDGLPAGHIKSIVANTGGGVWVGTVSGLVLVSGLTAQHVSLATRGGQAHITDMTRGPDGELYVLTREPAGVSRCESSTLTCVKLNHGKVEGWYGTDADRLAVTQQGHVYVSSVGLGVLQIAPGEPAKLWQLSHGVPSLDVHAMEVAANGDVWIGTQSGPARLETGQDRWQVPETGSTQAHVESLTVLHTGGALMGTRAGEIWRWNPDSLPTAARQRLSLVHVGETGAVGHLLRDEQGLVWAGTGGGELVLLNPHTGQAAAIGRSSGVDLGMIHTLVQDHEGIVWVGNDHGIAKLPPTPFENYNKLSGLPHDSIWSIESWEPNETQTLVVGTRSGLAMLRDGVWSSYDEDDGLGDDLVLSMAVTNDQRLFLGGGDHARGTITEVFERDSRIVFKVYGIESGVPPARIYSLTQGASGALLAGTADGLYAMTGETFKRVEVENIPVGTRINQVTVDGERTWLATSRGLAIIQGSEQRLLTKKDGLHSSLIKTVEYESSHTVWLSYGTGAGATRVHLSNIEAVPELSHVGAEEGLASNGVYAISAQGPSDIWFGTSKGITHFNGDTYVSLNATQGLVWNDINRNAMHAAPDGTTWLGTSRGLSHFSASRRPALTAPTVEFLEVRIGAFEALPDIRVGHDHRDFTARFAALTFHDETQLHYQTRLLGYEDAWSSPGAHAQISYTNLPAGSYEFQVRARRTHRGKAGPIARLPFTIEPPWTQTVPFYMLISLVALTLITGFVKIRVASLQRAKNKLQATIDQQTQTLREQTEAALAATQKAMETQSYLSNVLSSINDSVILLDLDYKVTNINTIFLELTGKDRADIIGQPFDCLLHESDILTLSGVESFVTQNHGKAVNIAFSTTQGFEDVSLSVASATVKDHAGTPTGFVLSGRDDREQQRLLAVESRAAAALRERADELTHLHSELQKSSKRERVHLENLLIQSEKLSQLGTMVSSIGHEISNPIMLLGMSVENTADTIADFEKQLMPLFTGHEDAITAGKIYQAFFDTLRKINNNAKTGAQRLRDVSMALRTQSRQEAEATPDVGLNDVIHECMVIVAGRTKLHQVEHTLSDLPGVTCFRSRIGQVITNLLANAADALTEKGAAAQQHGDRFRGQIQIKSLPLTRDGVEGILIVVSDNGDGVPAGIRKKIFEQFFTTKGAGTGTGLGLSMCASIVKEHGGTLGVSDDPDLGGARFELWLPIDIPSIEDESELPSATDSDTIEMLIPELIASALRFDERSLNHVLYGAARELSAIELMTRLIGPLMTEIGRLWETGELSVAVEHFAANVIHLFLKTRLESTTQLLADHPTVAFATLEGQRHGLGCMMAANVALDDGFPVLNLGIEVPACKLVETLLDENVTLLALSFIYPTTEEETHLALDELAKILPDNVQVVAGGRAAESYSIGLRALGATIMTDLSSFRNLLERHAVVDHNLPTVFQ